MHTDNIFRAVWRNHTPHRWMHMKEVQTGTTPCLSLLSWRGDWSSVKARLLTGLRHKQLSWYTRALALGYYDSMQIMYSQTHEKNCLFRGMGRESFELCGVATCGPSEHTPIANLKQMCQDTWPAIPVHRNPFILEKEHEGTEAKGSSGHEAGLIEPDTTCTCLVAGTCRCSWQ